MASKQKAWSSELWHEIGTKLPAPTVSAIIGTCKILCRAVFPYRSSGALVFRTAQTAYWQDLTIAEKKRWQRALAGWGWLPGNKNIDWDNDAALDIVRAGIWVWTRDMDGPLPKVLAAGASRRRKYLETRRDELLAHPMWKELMIDKMPVSERLEKRELIAVKAGAQSSLVLEWSNVEQELSWKNDCVPKLEKWFARHPAVSQETKDLWLNAWRK